MSSSADFLNWKVVGQTTSPDGPLGDNPDRLYLENEDDPSSRRIAILDFAKRQVTYGFDAANFRNSAGFQPRFTEVRKFLSWSTLTPEQRCGFTVTNSRGSVQVSDNKRLTLDDQM